MTITTPHQHRTSTWSPGAGYRELMTGAWARLAGDEFEIVVLTAADAEGGVPALVTGTVPAATMLSADSWLAEPDLLRALVARKLLDMQVIGAEHPALRHVEQHAPELGCGVRPAEWVALGLELDLLADHDFDETA